ncbi:MAG TPA: hypothetical protein VHW60_22225 [Caulobacteraceae bacterium]|jgi:hypothetical protein|nr:hypothetical protein [Caulobacteraceae bacterium]
MSDTKITATPKGLALYQIDADAKLGPAMNALAPRMRQFVLAKLQTGCSNAAAAQLAGYAGNADVLKAQGWKLAHDDRVQAAMLEEARKYIRDSSVMAIDIIIEIARNPEVDPKDRLKAAVELLNRGGLNAVSEHKVTVERTLDDEALVERVKMFAGRLGIDATKLLGRAFSEPPVDADFAEVVDDLSDILIAPPEPPPPPPTSAELSEIAAAGAARADADRAAVVANAEKAAANPNVARAFAEQIGRELEWTARRSQQESDDEN